MIERDWKRMRRLLQENALRRRSAELIHQWSTLGVSVTRISHERHRMLISQMRAGSSLLPWKPLIDIDAEVRAFADGCDFVTVMGWGASADPALIVPLYQLLRNIVRIEFIYRDGFVVFNESRGRALHIDFDNVDGRQCRLIASSIPGA